MRRGPGFLASRGRACRRPGGTTLMDFEFNQSSSTARRAEQGPHRGRPPDRVRRSTRVGREPRSTGACGPASDWVAATPQRRARPCGGGPAPVGTISTLADPRRRFRWPDRSARSGPHLRRGADRPAPDLRRDQVRLLRQRDAEVRSSDSFTSQPKDFIRPIDIDLHELRPSDHPEAHEPGQDRNTRVRLHQGLHYRPGRPPTPSP